MFPWIAAILLGALTPALVVAILLAEIRVLPLTFVVTLGHAVILGLPVALLYRAKHWTRLSGVIAGAFLIGAIPLGILAWPMGSSLESALVDGIATIINGIPTVAGWLDYLRALATFGAFGAAGGFVFWSTLKLCGVLSLSESNTTKAALGQSRIGMALAGAAVAASVAVAAVPTITKDRSCHNIFRDGRRSAAPRVSIDLDIGREEWPSLARRFQEFGTAHRMSFRNATRSQSAVEILSLSVCAEPEILISTHAPPLPGFGVSISVFDPNDGNKWFPVAQELVAALETEWPGKVRFRDQGRFVPKSKAMAPQAVSPPAE